MRISYGSSVYSNLEIDAVNKVLKTSTQMGTNVLNFEEKIAKIFGKKYGVMTNSGSSALLLALKALNFKKGSEVITPALTFGTTVSSIVLNELVPSFVDVERNTFCIDVNKIEKKISSKTAAILAPDLLGNICNWKVILNLAKKYNLKVIHDSADTLGATLYNKKMGYFSDITITSFYGSHIINGAGNGGMVCCSDKKIINKIKLLRSWGRSSSLYKNSESVKNRFNIKLDGIRYDKKFVFSEIGYQMEPSEISAAFALVQLKKLKSNFDIRNKIFKKHLSFFKKYASFFELPQQNMEANTCWLAFPLLVRPNKYFTRTDLQIFLEKKNIQTRVIFTGNILRQPGFKEIKCIGKADDFVNADYVMKNGILIGCHHGMTDEMLNYLYKNFVNFFNKIKN
jgi:CDP-6-deoxy-D-xylo-4-hexulose-3-dehydrase